MTSVIAYKLRETYSIELERGKRVSCQPVRNFEEISFERMVTYLCLRANDVNSGPFSVYAY